MDELKHNTRYKKLKQGNYYNFKYIKRVKLEDDNTYMVFEDMYGIRHFVGYKMYENYNLKLNTDVTCLLDKINCTGRIFLEPKHPVYRKGCTYSFSISQIIWSENERYLTVKDCFNNYLNISLNEEMDNENISQYKPGSFIKAKIVKIKKAIPELQLIDRPALSY